MEPGEKYIISGRKSSPCKVGGKELTGCPRNSEEVGCGPTWMYSFEIHSRNSDLEKISS